MKRKIVFLIVLSIVLTSVFSFTGFDVKSVSAATNPAFQKINFVNAVVTADHLNVRQGPSTKFPVICVLRKGQTVRVFGKIGTWYAVYEPATGCVGATSGTFLKQSGAAQMKAPTTAPKPAPVTKSGPTPKPSKVVAPPATTSAPSAAGISQDEQAVLNLVNKARADAGVGPLAFDMNLQKTARLKAKDMVDNNYFSHQSPTYGSPFDMMKQFGITFKTAGENIAGNQTVTGAFNAWMNSAGHKQNILNGSFNYTGIGIVVGSPYGKIFVQQFIGR